MFVSPPLNQRKVGSCHSKVRSHSRNQGNCRAASAQNASGSTVARCLKARTAGLISSTPAWEMSAGVAVLVIAGASKNGDQGERRAANELCQTERSFLPGRNSLSAGSDPRLSSPGGTDRLGKAGTSGDDVVPARAEHERVN